jgi:hypothetical protein
MSAKEIVSSGVCSDIVDAAITANRLISDVERELEILKAAIREIGSEAAVESGKNFADLAGELGKATVSFVKGAPKIRKDADLVALREIIGLGAFFTMFTTRTVFEPSANFMAGHAALTDSQKDAVANAVAIGDCHTRVTLAK